MGKIPSKIRMPVHRGHFTKMSVGQNTCICPGATFKYPQVANTCNLWYGSKMERDGDISVIEVEEFIFNGRGYSEIHISLNHINFDSKGHKRSSFTVEEVVMLFANAINGIFLEEDGIKGSALYYVYQYETADKKKYKFVFYTENKQVYIRLITLFRSRSL